MDLISHTVEDRKTKRGEECHLLQQENLLLKKERAISQPAQNAERRHVRNLVALWDVNVGKFMLGRQPKDDRNPDKCGELIFEKVFQLVTFCST